MTQRPTLDRIDRKLLELLQHDGSLTNVELAERVNLSPAPCLRRVAALEQAGVIRGYTALLDPRKLGYHLLAFVSVKLVKGGNRPSEQFHQVVRLWPEVTACYSVTGEMDYLLRVHVADLERYNSFMNEKLLRQTGVIDVHSSIVLEPIKETTALSLER